MTDEHVVHEVEDRVLTLTLNRPEKKNALTLAMYERLTEGLTRAATDSTIRVVLLRGSGGVFTGGNDLGDFMKNPPASVDSPVGRFLQALVGAPKPIVAAVEGPAIGIGTTMLLHCDFAYAAADARFQLPFVPLGLSPEAGSSYLLPRLCGTTRANELLLLGERFGASEALELGLVGKILPDGDALHAHARERALAIAALPPASVRATKRLMREAFATSLSAALERESGIFFERLRSPEAAEAMQAFFAKRKPDFSRFD